MPGRTTELRVGIFVTLALVVGTALVFALGNRSSMFAQQLEYTAVFSNVDGLRPGSPIRMSGMDIGTVRDVRFLDDGRAEIVLGVREDAARFIRQGTLAEDGETREHASTVTIGSKGLLGDKLVEITPGLGDPLAAGTQIPAVEGGGMFGALASAGAAIDEARPAIENVREFTATLADAQFRQDLADIAHNIAELTRMVREEDGTVNRLLTDEQLADRVESTLASVQTATTELAATARNLRAITGEIREGDGSVHQLIYGPEGTRLVTSLADTAGEAATILRDVRTGDGAAHELLYGEAAGDLVENLTAMSADLRAIVADMRAGRGTIGGLLVDPSIYEDVKRLVGNLERNDILRALVRYTIREDRAQDPPPEPREAE